jgi:hypothetical protein
LRTFSPLSVLDASTVPVPMPARGALVVYPVVGVVMASLLWCGKNRRRDDGLQACLSGCDMRGKPS